MPGCMRKKIQTQMEGESISKSKRIEEETMVVQKQGIVTILGSNYYDGGTSATSLRRTLSADMSSKTWLSQNGLSPIKKIASSQQLISHSHTKIADSDEDDYEEMKQEGFQIWNTIQKKEQHEDKTGQFDMWSSILSHKAKEETSKLTTPYIHPLVRRSKSCLSEKSLEICTESLGSETGSDGFSSYPPSETGDSEEEEEEEEQEQEKITLTLESKHEEEFEVQKYNYGAKKSLPRCFPPPLSSLSPQNGSSLHMRTHRDNGRLFLKAVSVPSQNNFYAQRQDGRLVLTFASEEVAQEEEEEEDDEAQEVESEIEEVPLFSSGITSVRRLALMMNKPIGLVNTDRNRSPKWSDNFNDVTNFKDVNVVQHSPLPPRPRARLISTSPASGAFNAYEYYWRPKPTSKPGPFTFQQNSHSSLDNNSNQHSNSRQRLLVLRGNNGDYLVHNLKNCKDSRRSFPFWEPYCIAT
ncbi:hypothetical protein VNO77_28700 [Canavalia gladiata]|uniref:FAF domain-containing protein n=1 Tax=Canavalia gladiata TaxID=3824 RepID=A0AAN9Q7W9_CANGL